eukprot:Seg6422.1 transcript_id=Seg6422.1/GoldUCD/mRNA.D3Y31 product="hypothetical protein" protein_id=Seg6422.1/GoldUCD/D3Y31
MHLRILFFLLTTLAIYSISKAENVDEKQTKCLGLCKEFVSFIYEIIQRKSLAAGVAPMQTLYNMVKTRAEGFCPKRVKHALECRSLVKNTWIIVVALEVGSNSDEVCKHLETCRKTKEKPKDKKDIMETFKPLAEVCAEILQKPSDRTNICGRIPSWGTALLHSTIKVLNGANFAQELTRCPKDGSAIGCYFKKAPPQIKIATGFIYSMMPDFSKITKKIQDRFLPPDAWCKLQELSKKGERKHHQILKDQCQLTCKFAARSFFASISLNPYDLTDVKEKIGIACSFMNLTQPDKCMKLATFASNFKATFSATMADHLCSNTACKMPTKAEIDKKAGQHCKKPVFKKSKPVQVAKFSAKRGAAVRVTTNAWFAGMIALVTASTTWRDNLA